MKKLILAIPLFLIPVAAMSQGLDPALLTKPATDSWPTYSGDYSGRRFSTLTQINQSNIKDLALSWVGHLTAGAGTGFGVAGGPPTIIGGEAAEAVPVGGAGAGAASFRRDPPGKRDSLISPRRTMLGPWTRAMEPFYGITSGRRRAARTSGIAEWRCMATGSILRRQTII